MLQQPIYSLFIRLIPESFLVFYSICLLTNSKKDFKKIFISAIIGGTGIYITRMLPIHFGVHTILAIILYIILAVNINKVDMNKAIAGTLISTILCFISDVIIVVFYTSILKLSPEIVSSQTLLAVVASLPSLIILYFLLKLYLYIRGKRVKHEQD